MTFNLTLRGGLGKTMHSHPLSMRCPTIISTGCKAYWSGDLKSQKVVALMEKLGFFNDEVPK